MSKPDKTATHTTAPIGQKRINVSSPAKKAGAGAMSAEPAAGPIEIQNGEAAALSLLLRIEELSRRAKDLVELGHVIANETRKLNRARQVFVIRIDPRARISVPAVSGVSAVDPSSMLAGSIAHLLQRLRAERGLDNAISFTLPAYCGENSELADSYPFRELAWVPFRDHRENVRSGMLLARELVWTDADSAISNRLGETFAHAWCALEPRSVLEPLWRNINRWRIAGLAAIALLLAVPVPITTLAPAEIVALDPMLITAPIDGVIDSIVIDPGSVVKAGDVLIRFIDTTLRNRREVAKREVAVADARVKQLTLLSFGDPKGRHDLGLAETELALKRAELSYATEMLDRSIIRATQDGLAVYADRKSMQGRPVAVGERLMEIADPAAIEVRVDVAMPDAIALKAASQVKLFLDVDPLRSWQAHVIRADYKARPSDSDVMSFRAFARLETGQGTPPRIGLRGTAQVYGDKAALVIFLLRRPLSAARQWFGL